MARGGEVLARKSSQKGLPPSPAGAADRIAALHAVPPAEFTRARDALARALAAEGSSEAERVKRLRRPTVALWLLNAAARERREALHALLDGGERLRKAQVRALRGDAGELRAATAAVHDALATLVDAARGVAAARGLTASASVLGQLEAAARAVAISGGPERDALRRGTLEQLPGDTETTGLDLLAGLASVPPPTAAPSPAKPTPSRRAPAPPASAAGGRASEARARAAAEKRARERARVAAERHARVLRAAEERMKRAERALADAQRGVDAARVELEAARRGAPPKEDFAGDDEQ